MVIHLDQETLATTHHRRVAAISSREEAIHLSQAVVTLPNRVATPLRVTLPAILHSKAAAIRSSPATPSSHHPGCHNHPEAAIRRPRRLQSGSTSAAIRTVRAARVIRHRVPVRDTLPSREVAILQRLGVIPHSSRADTPHRAVTNRLKDKDSTAAWAISLHRQRITRLDSIGQKCSALRPFVLHRISTPIRMLKLYEKR